MTELFADGKSGAVSLCLRKVWNAYMRIFKLYIDSDVKATLDIAGGIV